MKYEHGIERAELVACSTKIEPDDDRMEDDAKFEDEKRSDLHLKGLLELRRTQLLFRAVFNRGHRILMMVVIMFVRRVEYSLGVNILRCCGASRKVRTFGEVIEVVPLVAAMQEAMV